MHHRSKQNNRRYAQKLSINLKEGNNQSLFFKPQRTFWKQKASEFENLITTKKNIQSFDPSATRARKRNTAPPHSARIKTPKTTAKSQKRARRSAKDGAFLTTGVRPPLKEVGGTPEWWSPMAVLDATARRRTRKDLRIEKQHLHHAPLPRFPF